MTTAAPASPHSIKDVFALPVEHVFPNPDNPRRITDAHPSLPGMAATMKEVGQLQPIVARKLPDGRGWLILAGERRWRAARLAGLATIEAKVVDANDQQAFAMTVVENLQRDDLHWLEEARGVEAMTARGWDIATSSHRHLGKSPSSGSRLRAKLASISPEVAQGGRGSRAATSARWPAAMLELIARPIEQQDASLRTSWSPIGATRSSNCNTVEPTCEKYARRRALPARAQVSPVGRWPT
jgi:ParB family chromosome partitioning protein